MTRAEEAKQQVDTIVDVFTGADGGVAFVRFRQMIDSMVTQADDGDAASREVLKVVERFYRLVNLANTF